MENKKTLKPGQLATVKSRITGMRGIVRASKKVTYPCHKCFLQNNNIPPCMCIMLMEECQQMFGWDMFPIVIAKVHNA
jgi:hypothetical protein